MKHISQYESDEWANARDRRASRRRMETEANSIT
jgi:mannose-1-phosphate guanylyltransferase